MIDMTSAVEKTISLPPDRARTAEQIARAEGKDAECGRPECPP